MTEYHKRFEELLKQYNKKSRDCYLLYDFLNIRDELRKDNSIDKSKLYDIIFEKLEERVREASEFELLLYNVSFF